MKEPDFHRRKISIAVWERYVKFALAGAVGLAAIAGIAWYWSGTSQKAQPGTAAIHFVKASDWSSGEGLTMAPAISRDGKMAAYASDRDGSGSLAIWTQELDSEKAARLTSGDFNETDPDFSADGRQIVFRSERDGGGIYVAPLGAGAPRLVVKEGWKPKFSPDGNWISYCNLSGSDDSDSALGSSQIFIVATAGGEPRRIQPAFPLARDPIWSPDSKRLLFMGLRSDGVRDWWVSSLDGAEAVRTFAVERLRGSIKRLGLPEQWRADKLFFAAAEDRKQHLWEVAISPVNWQVSGPPRRLTDGDGIEQQAAVGPGGRVLFTSMSLDIDLWTVPIDANQGRVSGQLAQLTTAGSASKLPSLAAAVPKLVYISDQSGVPDAWVRDLDSGKEEPVTSFRQVGYRPVMSPDGLRIAYPSRMEGRCAVLLQSARPDTRHQSTLPGCFGIWDWSPDGASLLTFQLNGPMKSVESLAISSGERKTVVTHPKQSTYGVRYSPDGRFIAFASGVGTGDARIFIAPLRVSPASEQEWIPVTGRGDGDLAWSPDGNVLYFRSKRDGQQCIWAQKLGPAKQPVGEPIAIQHFHKAALGLHLMRVPDFNITVGKNQLILNLVKARGVLRSIQLDE